MRGTVLGSGDTVMEKPNKELALMEFRQRQ